MAADGVTAVPGRGAAFVAALLHHDLGVARLAVPEEVDAVFGVLPVVGRLVRHDLELVVLDARERLLKLLERGRRFIPRGRRGKRRSSGKQEREGGSRTGPHLT